MNFCRKCESDYEKPGTCNCFAPTPAQQAAPSYAPWYPVYPFYTPWWTIPATTNAPLPMGTEITWYTNGGNS